MHRHWRFMLLFLFLCGAPHAFGATREERMFATASAALQLELHARAEAEFSAFLAEFPKSPRAAEAVLYQAQAQFRQGKNSAAINTLSSSPVPPGKLADRYAYLIGEAQFARGDFEHASETFRSLTESHPESPLRLNALIEAAAALERLGDWPEIEKLLGEPGGTFVRTTARNPHSELACRGRLLLAQSELAQEKYEKAMETLRSIEAATLTDDLAWQRDNLLCRIHAGRGDWTAALEITTNLLQTARTQDVTRRADSVAWRCTVLEHLGKWEDAGAAWSENLTNSAPVEWQREAVLRIAAAALKQKKFTDAQSSLEKFITLFPQAPATPVAMLTLGELHLRDFAADTAATNRLAEAQSRFEQVLAATNVPEARALKGKALLQLGWCHWLNGKIPESLDHFQRAVENLPFSEDLAVARLKTGDALFVQKDYAGARAQYKGMLEQFRNVPSVIQSLGDRALYQILRASIEMKDASEADMAMRQMLARFPSSQLADNGLLLLGEGYSDLGSTTNALKVFQDFAVIFPESTLAPQVKLARARTLEQNGNWPDAVADYQAWLSSHPTNLLRSQVEYALGRAQFRSGDETGALQTFTNLVTKYPASEFAPLAQWWVADHYFRTGTNYQDSEKNYEMVFQTPQWRSNTNLHYQAQLMAARAAAARLGFADAANHLTRLASDTKCPPALRTQALFTYGSVLMRMDSADTNKPLANFELATNIFAQLSIANATNTLGPLALSELGDCNLQLGALAAATNAYARVAESPLASVGLRSRARIGWGRALEKQAETADAALKAVLLEQALNCYLDVFETGYGRSLSDAESADAFWVKKAGMLALPLLSGENCPVNFLNRMEALMPQLKKQIEKKRAALKLKAPAAQPAPDSPAKAPLDATRNTL